MNSMVNCCLPQCGGHCSRGTLCMGGVSPDRQYNGKLLFIVLSTFLSAAREKLQKRRCLVQNLRFSLRTQLPRDARRSPIGEWSGYRVSCVSQRRHSTPAAERLGVHTAPVDRWDVGMIAPSVSSNVEAIALTFRNKRLYGGTLKLALVPIVLAENQHLFSIRCQNCGFTDAARKR